MEKASRNYMGARRGGETDQQNVIMHKAYYVDHGLIGSQTNTRNNN